MKIFVQEGRTLDFVADGAVKAGVPVLVGVILVIPATNAAAGQTYSGWIEGVFVLPCQGQAWATNCIALYWDAANARVTTSANGNTKIGMTAAPKVAADIVGNVKLLPSV
ncbi:hypothetical protein GCM10022253_23990 [Sphingomonas endophytica]|uniref:RecA/RadA family phage recombinase n=1 Tax=Sphingomonas endophytica TaxID=869719 RepID=A0ABR6N2N0_9SPHN|nr:DUF2190 family protein [Sphingomonas endophytica]MBB5725047.1 putative RecA/RadA family phage recombinase [Sphingomonas endophytica]